MLLPCSAMPGCMYARARRDRSRFPQRRKRANSRRPPQRMRLLTVGAQWGSHAGASSPGDGPRPSHIVFGHFFGGRHFFGGGGGVVRAATERRRRVKGEEEGREKVEEEREDGSGNGGTLGRLRAREPECGIPRGRAAAFFYGGMLGRRRRAKLAFPFGTSLPRLL